MLIKFFLASLALYAGYLLLGAVTTVIFRLKNPLHEACRSGKRLCLTFDDGIDPRYTPRLLDLLAEHHIHATFFILAQSAERYPDILQRMKQEGHTVGLHSLDHQNQILQLPHQLWLDFRKSMKIFAAQNTRLTFYRPPWGHVTPMGLWLCRQYHLHVVLWTVIIGDWSKKATVESLCQKLRTKVHGSVVICLHDGRGTNHAPLRTIATLETMLPQWKKEGYTFETISEFLEKGAH